MKPETLTRLLEMGGDVAQRHKFLLDATQGMSADAIVYLVQAAATTEKQTVSHSMVRLLSKLARHAETGIQTRRAMADRSLRDTVTRLVSEWTLADPNPEAYRAVLEEASRTAATGPNAAASGRALDCEPDRIVKIALEIGAVGNTVWRAVDRLEREGRAGYVLDLLADAPDRAAATEIVRHLAEGGSLKRLITAERVDFATAERIIERAGAIAVPVVLNGAAEVSDARRREHVYDLVAVIGDVAPPLVARRLAETNRPGAWPTVERDLIALLGRLSHDGALPAGVELLQYLQHPDAQVRREAVKVMLRSGGAARDEALVAGVDDSDSRIVYLALTAACERCPRHAVSRIRLRVERSELDPSLRALGIRAAATVRTPDTLGWLASRVIKASRLLGRPSLLPATPETVAAVTAIAAGWRNDPAAAQVVTLAHEEPRSAVSCRHAWPTVAAGERLMSDPIRFLTSFVQSLSTMALYGEKHPARERSVDRSFEVLRDLQAVDASPQFTFLGDETVYGQVSLRDMRDWEWAARLGNAGVQRLEFAPDVTRDEYEEFLEEVLARLALTAIDTSEMRTTRRTTIKFGAIGVRGESREVRPIVEAKISMATLGLSLHEEAAAVEWMHDEVSDHGTLPLAEAEAVVRSLSLAMHGESEMMIPLLEMREFDEYTTTHSLNVAVLTMALAEYLELSAREVRALRRGRIAARPWQGARAVRHLEQARQAHRRGARGDAAPHRRGRADHPHQRSRARPRRRRRVRTPHHDQRRGVSELPLPPRLSSRQQAGARLRRVRRAAHASSVPRRLGIRSRARLRRKARRH